MNLNELIARAIIAGEGEGHNDPPLYDDYDPIVQESYRRIADFVVETITRHGYAITEKS